MTVTRSGLDNHRLEGTHKNGLGNAIRHHKSARLKIDKTIDAFPLEVVSEREMKSFDRRLEKAAEDEERARLAFLGYPVVSLAEVRAKADHVRLLLSEGDELDKIELELLLLSMM